MFMDEWGCRIINHSDNHGGFLANNELYIENAEIHVSSIGIQAAYYDISLNIYITLQNIDIPQEFDVNWELLPYRVLSIFSIKNIMKHSTMNMIIPEALHLL